MSGFLLRLSAPMQSWGEHSAFNRRETQRFPTRSGLIGLFANALGRPRSAPLDEFTSLSITVRIDRPGVSMMDFHTVGGGLPAKKALPTAEGKRRGENASTLVSNRYYLADAAFTIAVTGPADTCTSITEALKAPHWPLYLGRRSCPPDQPLLLHANASDPVAELQRVPVPARLPEKAEPILEFLYEGRIPGAAAITELDDVPVSFTSRARKHTTRQISSSRETLPRALWTGRGRTHLLALSDYIKAAT
ncbi:type I-E CRISPR-associated protein Cas5/CasD [Actinorhabdospora filicis]|uniref:Type I-E CRISPR-associated protein Cas5/CasD n=1 Tax=Actinorhabdospora filicis TaxID=1785913 RepID=A0A9W6WB50_9ACTN|nr:type I-E CRISPR-associated protein Cas5/CasD [Actinorhabdospora filicis]GLZ78350.1 type I-E CRISPR-associated protein Cas5/CasD [Actinorhabdospora filicis]